MCLGRLWRCLGSRSSQPDLWASGRDAYLRPALDGGPGPFQHSLSPRCSLFVPRIHLHGKEYFLRSEKVPQSDVGCFVLYVVRSRRSSSSLLPGGKWKGIPLGARSRPHRESGRDRVRDNWRGLGGGRWLLPGRSRWAQTAVPRSGEGTATAQLLSPRFRAHALCNKRSHHNDKPMYHGKDTVQSK